MIRQPSLTRTKMHGSIRFFCKAATHASACIYIWLNTCLCTHTYSGICATGRHASFDAGVDTGTPAFYIFVSVKHKGSSDKEQMISRSCKSFSEYLISCNNVAAELLIKLKIIQKLLCIRWYESWSIIYGTDVNLHSSKQIFEQTKWRKCSNKLCLTLSLII